MKKIIFIFPLVFFCCKNNDKKNTDTNKGEVQQAIVPDSTWKPTVVLSSLAKQKVTEAFALVQKYAMETIVMPKNVGDSYVRCYKSVAFGKITNSSNSGSYVEVENKTTKPDELLILFEDLPLPPAGSYAVTNYLEDGKALISLNTKVAEQLSTAIIASVIFHELAHVQFFTQGLYQTRDDKTQAKNEGAAYLRQLSFLVWVYGGVKKEFDFSKPIKVDVPLPSMDREHFLLFQRREQEMSAIILR
jgi:hypothetical protein